MAKTPGQKQREKTAKLNARRREGKTKGITSPYRLVLYAHGLPDPVRDNPKVKARVDAMLKKDKR